MTSVAFNPAAELIGHCVAGWHVTERISTKNSSGGNFSFGYKAHDDNGNIVFLKALDYSQAFKNPATQIDVLNSMTSAYIFERDLLAQCSKNRVRNVIRLLKDGAYKPNSNWPYAVNYLVMEMADGSARDMLSLNASLDTLWALKSLHGTAVAIQSLHNANIAHQDIKPSNVLYFNDTNVSKIGDVGRASSLDVASQHDEYDFAGDSHYSPPEQLYRFVDSDWKKEGLAVTHTCLAI